MKTPVMTTGAGGRGLRPAGGGLFATRQAGLQKRLALDTAGREAVAAGSNPLNTVKPAQPGGMGVQAALAENALSTGLQNDYNARNPEPLPAGAQNWAQTIGPSMRGLRAPGGAGGTGSRARGLVSPGGAGLAGGTDQTDVLDELTGLPALTGLPGQDRAAAAGIKGINKYYDDQAREADQIGAKVKTAAAASEKDLLKKGYDPQQVAENLWGDRSLDQMDAPKPGRNDVTAQMDQWEAENAPPSWEQYKVLNADEVKQDEPGVLQRWMQWKRGFDKHKAEIKARLETGESMDEIQKGPVQKIMDAATGTVKGLVAPVAQAAAAARRLQQPDYTQPYVPPSGTGSTVATVATPAQVEAQQASLDATKRQLLNLFKPAPAQTVPGASAMRPSDVYTGQGIGGMQQGDGLDNTPEVASLGIPGLTSESGPASKYYPGMPLERSGGPTEADTNRSGAPTENDTNSPDWQTRQPLSNNQVAGLDPARREARPIEALSGPGLNAVKQQLIEIRRQRGLKPPEFSHDNGFTIDSGWNNPVSEVADESPEERAQWLGQNPKAATQNAPQSKPTKIASTEDEAIRTLKAENPAWTDNQIRAALAKSIKGNPQQVAPIADLSKEKPAPETPTPEQAQQEKKAWQENFIKDLILNKGYTEQEAHKLAEDLYPQRKKKGFIERATPKKNFDSSILPAWASDLNWLQGLGGDMLDGIKKLPGRAGQFAYNALIKMPE